MSYITQKPFLKNSHAASDESRPLTHINSKGRIDTTSHGYRAIDQEDAGFAPNSGPSQGFVSTNYNAHNVMEYSQQLEDNGFVTLSTRQLVLYIGIAALGGYALVKCMK